MPSQTVDYHRYMASREWRVRRQEVISFQNNICGRCLSAQVENVHHLTYERLGREWLGDLQGLCRPCHRFVSAEQCDDPAVIAVRLSLLTNGLKAYVPNVAWEGPGPIEFTTGPTSKGCQFEIEFRATPDPLDYVSDRDIIIPWREGVWLHAYCL